MTSIRLRPAAPQDDEWLYALHRAALREVVEAAYGPWDDADQRERFAVEAATAPRFVVLAGDEPVGVVQVDDSGEGEVFLALVEVLPGRQGEGLGTAAVAAVRARAAEAGRGVRLQVLHANPRARALYERLGFTETGRTATHVLLRAQPSNRTTSA